MQKFKELLHKVIRTKQDYLDYVRAGYEEWACGDRHNNPPQFFTGSIESELAVISLNEHTGDAKPKNEVTYTDIIHKDKWNWDVYYQFYSNFCHERYDEDGRAAHQIPGLSNFDRELHCFFSGNLDPQKEDLARWKIFHAEISHIGTTNYNRPQEETEDRCLSLLRTLEAISIKKRSLIVLLNREGCILIKKMNRKGMLKAEHIVENDKRFSINPNNDNLARRNAERIDYNLTLPNGNSINLIATPTFPLRQVGNRFAFMQRYYQYAFTQEEKKILAAGLGINH